MTVRWVLFDIGGVLERTDDTRWPALFQERWADRLGLTTEEYRRRLDDADLPDTERRSGVEEEFWRRYGEALGTDAEQLARLREDFWDAYCGEANEVLLGLARELVGRVGLAALSNSGDGARREEERRFGLSTLLDPICYSHEIGVAKPDLAAFHTALARMDAGPGEVLFVDDHPANVAAAAALGMRTVLHRDDDATVAAVRAAVPGDLVSHRPSSSPA